MFEAHCHMGDAHVRKTDLKRYFKSSLTTEILRRDFPTSKVITLVVFVKCFPSLPICCKTLSAQTDRGDAPTKKKARKNKTSLLGVEFSKKRDRNLPWSRVIPEQEDIPIGAKVTLKFSAHSSSIPFSNVQSMALLCRERKI